MADGITAELVTCYKYANEIVISMRLYKASFTQGTNITVATLPTDYKAEKKVIAPCSFFDGTSGLVTIDENANAFYIYKIGSGNTDRCVFSFSFPIK